MGVIWPTAIILATGLLLTGSACCGAIYSWIEADRDAKTEAEVNSVLSADVTRLRVQTTEQRRLLTAAGRLLEQASAKTCLPPGFAVEHDPDIPPPADPAGTEP